MAFSETKQDQPFALIAAAIDCFATAQPDNANVPSVVHGLDFLCRAAMSPDAAQSLNRPLVNSELWRIAPIISGEVDGFISAERIFFVLGMSSMLLCAPEDEFHVERIAHVTLLAADLKSLVLRRWLSDRGDRLSRTIAANQIWATADHAPHVLQ